MIKLMIGRNIQPSGARVLCLGLTFKENCPDVRNTKVADVVKELQSFGCRVDVHDPWVDARRSPSRVRNSRWSRSRRRGATTRSSSPSRTSSSWRSAPKGFARVRQPERRDLRHQARAAEGRFRRSSLTRADRSTALKLLVTGAAGFIGFHTAKNAARARRRGRRARQSQRVLRRHAQARAARDPREVPEFQVREARPCRPGAAWPRLFAAEKFERVIHLGAQAGVRYSITAPFAYISSNVIGTMTVLEGCRHNGVQHLVFASTSSVYGANTRDAVLRASERRPSALALCSDEEGQRAHGAHLREPLRLAGDGSALLHGLRAVRSARHGPVPVHEGYSGGQADRRVQLRPPPARFHLRRRHRRGCCARNGPRRRAEPEMGRRQARSEHEQGAISASTTSAISSRSS